MQIAVSDLIRAGFEETVRGPDRRRLLEDLGRSDALAAVLPEQLLEVAWAADSPESSRDALWATVMAAYRRAGGTPWGAVILELVRPVLIPALERLDGAGLPDEPVADDSQPDPTPTGVPTIGLERPGGYALLDDEDVAQQVLTELLAIARTCQLPAPTRWAPHRLTTQTVRQVRRWLRSQITSGGAATSLDVAEELGDSEPPLAERAVLGALMERGLSQGDAELIYRARVLRIPIRALAQSSGLTFDALKRRHSRAREKLRQAAAAA